MLSREFLPVLMKSGRPLGDFLPIQTRH